MAAEVQARSAQYGEVGPRGEQGELDVTQVRSGGGERRGDSVGDSATGCVCHHRGPTHSQGEEELLAVTVGEIGIELAVGSAEALRLDVTEATDLVAAEGPGPAAGAALGNGGIGAAPVNARTTAPVMQPSDPPGVTVAARIHGRTPSRVAAGADAIRVVLGPRAATQARRRRDRAAGPAGETERDPRMATARFAHMVHVGWRGAGLKLGARNGWDPGGGNLRACRRTLWTTGVTRDARDLDAAGSDLFWLAEQQIRGCAVEH